MDVCTSFLRELLVFKHFFYWLGRQLFGEGYSGLEYDYRGLVRLYTQKGEYAKADHYRDIINQWSVLRDSQNAREVCKNRHYNYII